MNRRAILLSGGIAAFAVGIVATFTPAVLSIRPRDAFASLVGVVALLLAIHVLVVRRRPLGGAATGDPEVPESTPQPGDDFEEVLRQFAYASSLSIAPGGRLTDERKLREGLRAAALSVLMRYGTFTREGAKRQLELGSWTDDPVAAEYLGGPEAPPESLIERLRAVLARESHTARNARSASEAIARYAGFPPPTDEPPSWIDRHVRGDETFLVTGGETLLSTADGEEERDDGDGEGGEDDDGHAAVPKPTRHWYGVGIVTLLALGTGILADRPSVMLLGVVGIGFAAYARFGSPGAVDVSIERTVDADRPRPGDTVPVTLTVKNDGDGPLFDLRVVDGVPETLPVVEGSPRLGTTLRPGEEATLEYAVAARRGVHEFEPVQVLEKDVTGGLEAERFVGVETALTCVPPLRATAGTLGLRKRAARFTGRVEIEEGGDGIEFYSTREYRAGDAMNRIDWNRRARTGELATLEFRQERSATVVVVIDARRAALLSPEPHAPHALDRSVEAASQIFTSLSDGGNRVGIAAVGSSSCWLAPGVGSVHRARARELLATHPVLAPVPPEEEEESNTWRWRKGLRQRLARDTQIVFVSPLCDVYAVRIARYLEAEGHPVTVIAPDPTAEYTARHRLARVAREFGVADLRTAGLEVIDWEWDEPLDVAIARSRKRWSR